MGTYIERLEEEVEVDKEKQGSTVTVSGFSGCGKTTLARSIANEAGLKHKKVGQIFRELAEDRGMTIEEFAKEREDKVDLMVDKKTLKLAMEGGYVLDARLSGWVAGDHADIKIFLKTDPEIATKRLKERENISYEEAYERTQIRDEVDRSKYRKLYGIDFDDLSIFDFVINNGIMELQQLKKFGKIVADILDNGL